MTNKEYCANVKKMTLEELFEEVMDSPQYLTDSYYRELGKALRERYSELTFYVSWDKTGKALFKEK